MGLPMFEHSVNIDCILFNYNGFLNKINRVIFFETPGKSQNIVKMIFSYYSKLSRKQKLIYKKSDDVASIKLHDTAVITPLIQELKQVLEEENRTKLEKLSVKITNSIIKDLNVSTVKLKVLAVRPSNDWGELHGLYEPEEDGKRACISVWMRTAKHKKVVAFRTFLRTLLHELCHHFDYELLKLEDSFHTEGFFKRESSLFKQIVMDEKMQAK